VFEIYTLAFCMNPAGLLIDSWHAGRMLFHHQQVFEGAFQEQYLLYLIQHNSFLIVCHMSFDVQ